MLKFFCLCLASVLIRTCGALSQSENTAIILPESKRNILIVSRITSGSSFFGELIQSYDDKTFYTFEPLIMRDHYNHVDPNEHIKKSIETLNEVFKCDFSKQKKYISWILRRKNHNFWNRNIYLLNSARRKHI